MIRNERRLAAGVVAFGLLLAACGSGNEASESPAASEASESPAASGEKILMRISSEVGLDVDPNPSMVRWAELVATESDGQIEIQLVHSGQLFDDDAALDAVAAGSIQGVTPTSARVVGYSGDFSVLDLPFAYANADQFEQCVRGELGGALNESLEGKGLATKTYLSGGPLTMMNNEGELRDVAAWEGQKIRTFGGGIYEATYLAAGMSPIQLPATEVPTAIQQGTIDSILTNWDGWAAVFIDLVNYGMDPGAWFLTFPLVVNAGWWNSLPTDAQDLLNRTLTQITDEDWVNHGATEQRAQDELIAAGKTIYTLTPTERETWVTATDPVRDEYVAELSPGVQQALASCTGS